MNMTTPALPTRKIRRRNTKGNDGKALHRRSLQTIFKAVCMCIFLVVIVRILRSGSSAKDDNATSFHHKPLSDVEYERSRADVISKR